ncbi:MAG: trigger factor [Candidatus Peribacteraceae bacterium]|nr:trigger factor [Candidatus Peribacteraceae bacterium]
MEISIEKLKQCRIQATVIVAEDERRKAEEAALAAIGQHVRVKGFREGKAPAGIVRGQAGEERILEETVRRLLPQMVRSALEKSAAKPIMQPSASVKSTSPLTVTILFVERPTVILKKPDSITVEKKRTTEVTEQDIARVLRRMMEHDITETPVDRAAANGDSVQLSLKSTDKDGKPVEELTVDRYKTLIGSEELLPEIAKAAVGMKKGDKKTVTIPFSKTHDINGLRGKTVTVEMTATVVNAVTLPELTQAFIKTRFGVERTPEGFKAEVKEMLAKQRKNDEMKRREEEFFKAVRAATTVDLAQELIDAETREMLHDLEERLKKQEMSLEQWMKMTGKKPNELGEEMKKIAIDRITLRMGLQEFVEKKKIELTEEEMKKLIDPIKEHADKDGHPIPEEELKPNGGVYEQVRWEQRMKRAVEEAVRD